jgi:hypothetical protein
MKLKKLLRRLNGQKGNVPQVVEHITMCEQGVILEDDSGHDHRWQADGCCCAHPTARGFFYPCDVPAEIQVLFGYDRPAQDDIARVFTELGIHATPSSDGMEAWLPIELPSGKRAVIVWNNRD